MKKLVISNGVPSYVALTENEQIELAERESLEKLEQAFNPSDDEIKESEYDLKLITKLTEWGVI